MSDNPEDFYSDAAEEFSQDYSIENMPEKYVELLERFVKLVGSGRVLDAGCGHGRDVEYFEKNGLDALGIDLAGAMIAHAEQSKKGDFRVMDIRDLDLEDNEFKGVWCNTVTQLFPPEIMKSIIKELSRVLEKDGVLYITFKIGEGSITREGYGDEVKQYLVSRKEGRQKVVSEKLEIIEEEKSEVNGQKVLHLFCRKK